MKFKQFVEAKKLPFGFSMKRPPKSPPVDDDDEFAVINPNANLPENLKKFAGQIVAIDHDYTFHHHDDELTICPLTGKNDEGSFYVIPKSMLWKATDEEVEQGKWLSKTFFHRDEYSPTKVPVKYIQSSSSKDSEILTNAEEKLQKHGDSECEGLLDSLREEGHLLSTWKIIADKLEDLGENVAELRKFLSRQEFI